MGLTTVDGLSLRPVIAGHHRLFYAPVMQ